MAGEEFSAAIDEAKKLEKKLTEYAPYNGDVHIERTLDLEPPDYVDLTYSDMLNLYERSQKAGNKNPYELPESFLKKKAAVSLATPINFVSTCDSIGGNSGSPLVNRKGEFVGVLFDGNIQSLPTRFVYEDRISRSVMVHGRGIIEALLKIYGKK
jgi:hypothetical protein